MHMMKTKASLYQSISQFHIEQYHQSTSSPQKESTFFDASFGQHSSLIFFSLHSHLQTQMHYVDHQIQEPVLQQANDNMKIEVSVVQKIIAGLKARNYLY